MKSLPSQVGVGDEVASVETWSCALPLPAPLKFGSFELRERAYVALRIRTKDGIVSDCLGLARRAPVDVVIADLLGPALVGSCPLDIDARLADMRRVTSALGPDGTVMRALSLVEICLWDIRAQAMGVPLWRLLGGAPRSLPVLLAEGYPIAGESSQDFAERVAARVEEGYRIVKLEVAGFADPSDVVERLAAIRKLCGDRVELVVDLFSGWATVADAIDAARRWSEFGLAWIEDPFPHERLVDMKRLRDAVAAPIGAGDEVTRSSDLAALVTTDAVDVLRVDATTVGGISAVRDLVATAGAHHKRVSLHIHPDVQQHCSFAWLGLDHIEAFPLDRPFDRGHELIEAPFLAGTSGGWASPPEAPGTGLRLNLDAVVRHAYRHATCTAG